VFTAGTRLRPPPLTLGDGEGRRHAPFTAKLAPAQR